MNKRLSQLVAVGFAILISLGLAINIFLTLAVQQTLTEARQIEATAIETRAATRSLRADYLERGSSVALVLLDPVFNKTHQRKLQKLNGIADAHLDKAFKHTARKDLKLLLSRLKAHNEDVTRPLQLQLFRLVQTDKDKARLFYLTDYIPAQIEDIQTSEAALEIATQEVIDLKEDVENRSERAQLAARMAIMLFVVLGVGSGFFLTRAVGAIARQSEQAAHANRNMLEYSRDVICSIDEAGRFIDVSPGVHGGLGLFCRRIERASLSGFGSSRRYRQNHRCCTDHHERPAGAGF